EEGHEGEIEGVPTEFLEFRDVEGRDDSLGAGLVRNAGCTAQPASEKLPTPVPIQRKERQLAEVASRRAVADGPARHHQGSRGPLHLEIAQKSLGFVAVLPRDLVQPVEKQEEVPLLSGPIEGRGEPLPRLPGEL